MRGAPSGQVYTRFAGGSPRSHRPGHRFGLKPRASSSESMVKKCHRTSPRTTPTPASPKPNARAAWKRPQPPTRASQRRFKPSPWNSGTMTDGGSGSAQPRVALDCSTRPVSPATFAPCTPSATPAARLTCAERRSRDKHATRCRMAASHLQWAGQARMIPPAQPEEAFMEFPLSC